MVGSLSGSNLGMGVAFVLEDYFSSTADTIERRMGRLDTNTDALSSRINSSLNQIKLGAVSLATGLLILAPFYKGAMLEAQFEADRTALQTLLGTADKARFTFEQIKQTAAVTPFMTKDLLQANIALMSQNIEAERSQKIVRNLGNALSAVGKGSEELSRMSINLQQIAANGTAAAMDIKQFGYAGINIMQLYSDATGIATTALKDHKFTLEDIELALDHASKAGGRYAGAMDRMSQTIFGKISTLKDNVSFMFASIGASIEPLTHKLVDFFIKVTAKIQAFAESPFGKAIFTAVAGLGILLTVGGAVLIMLGSMRFLVYSAANAFGAKTKAIIIDTIVTKGLTAGLREMAVAAWAALAPILAYVAIGAAVIAVAYGIYYVIDRNTQIFKKLGGIVDGLIEIWKSFNGETFTLSEGLSQHLEKLGILDTVIALGTWLVRIKTFLSGVWDGMKEGFSVVWNILKTVGHAINESILKPILHFMDSIGIHINKNTSDLHKWAQAGKVVGYIIVGVLVMIGIQMTILAFQTIAALWPVILIIGAIIAVVWAAYYVVQHWGEIWGWIKEKAMDAIVWILTGLGDLISWFTELPGKAYEAGKNMIQSLWDGAKQIMGDFITWIDKKISEIPILGQLYGFGKSVIGGVYNYITGNDEQASTPALQPAYANNNYSRQGTFDSMARMKSVTNNYTNFRPQQTEEQKAPLIVQFHMDGDKVAEKVIDKTDFMNARKGNQ